MKVAVVGSGIAGLVTAHLLHPHHEVTVFEAGDRPGGHTNTVEVTVDGRVLAVDTGFIVYNEHTYPAFVRLLAHFGVATKASEMSFSVADEATGLEWRGTSPNTLFAQRRNLANRAFHRLLLDVTRFNREARRLAADPDACGERTLGDFLAEGRWSPQLLDWYLVPLGSAIWSADPGTFAAIPLGTFVRFFENHGLLRVGNQLRWRTVEGGAARYVEAILAPLAGRIRLGQPINKVVRHGDGVELRPADGGPETFDHVVLATHSDQALHLLGDPSDAERAILGAIRYQPNRATLHTDARLLPRNRRAWASWNYHRPVTGSGLATVTYLMNRLQGLDTATPVLVTLNREAEIDPATVLGTYDYDHPVLDAGAVRAQGRRAEIDGVGRTSFAGAYWAAGFHEDGVQSALAACRRLGVEPPW